MVFISLNARREEAMLGCFLLGAVQDLISIQPVGGFFRLLSRRLLGGLQFFPGPLIFVAALFLVPPALICPLFDGLDREKNFTLGYICSAAKR